MTVQGMLGLETKLSPLGDRIIRFLEIDSNGKPAKYPVTAMKIVDDVLHEVSPKEIAEECIEIISSAGGVVEPDESGPQLSLFTREEVAILSGKPFIIRKKEEE